MRLLLPLLLLLTLPAPARPAAPPRLLLEVAQFRALDQRTPTGELDLTVTVPTQTLLYRQRVKRMFQASAVVELSVVKTGAQQPVWRETVTLRPPVQSDTGAAIKNPVVFLRRVLVPDGAYVLRGLLRDQNRPAAPPAVVELPLTVAAPVGPAFSDVMLLATPPAPTPGGEGETMRGGLRLTRAPAGLYARGAEVLYFYTELNNLPPGRPVRLRYRFENGALGETTLTPAQGRPTVATGQLPLGGRPTGPFVLMLVARDAATNKLLASQRQTGEWQPADYMQAGAEPAPAPR